MFESRYISIRIHRPAEEVYAFAKDPESFPKWAAGLASGLTRDGERWVAHGPGGDVRVRFSPDNPYGVLDHWVTLADGTELYMPLRVVANGHLPYRRPLAKLFGQADRLAANDKFVIYRCVND